MRNDEATWKALESLKIDVHVGNRAGRADRVFYEHLQEGLRQNDWDKIYEFIFAVERGCEIDVNSQICQLIQKAYSLDGRRLCTFIAGKRNLYEYWYYLSGYCNCEMLSYFVKLDVEDPVFYFECARLLLKRTQKNSEYEEAIAIAVRKVAEKDLNLWKRWVTVHENNICWLKILDRVLGDLDQEALRIYATSITLDMPMDREKSEILSQFYQKIPVEKQEHVFRTVCNIVYERWTNLIEQKKRERKFQNKILLSPYTNFVVYSMRYVISKGADWESVFTKAIHVLEQDMNDWYASLTDMKSVFFYDITLIYYLLLIGESEKYVLENNELHAEWMKLGYILQRYEDFWDAEDVSIRNKIQSGGA